MGQKTHPRGLRLGIIETWDSKWYNDKEYALWLHEDLKIQEFVKEKLSRAGISRVEVERVADRCSINVHTARPGIVIGRRGVEAEKLQADLEKFIGRSVRINVTEIKSPELDAHYRSVGYGKGEAHNRHLLPGLKSHSSSSKSLHSPDGSPSLHGRPVEFLLSHCPRFLYTVPYVQHAPQVQHPAISTYPFWRSSAATLR